MHPALMLVAVFCIALASGAAGAINMWYDRDIDAVMLRTRTRPLPQGRVQPSDALAFGVVLSLVAVSLMGLAINWVAAALLALASLYYVFVYTIWLKRRTPHNIVIGGAAGAFPPMIGWAAMTGNVSLEAVILFAIIFFWTPPHFWALALYRNADYGRAGVPMLPVVAGPEVTKRHMLGYTLTLLPLTVLPYGVGISGPFYLVGAIVLSLTFIVAAWRVLKSSGHGPARQMFGFSILYLFLIFGLLVADARNEALVTFFGGW